MVHRFDGFVRIYGTCPAERDGGVDKVGKYLILGKLGQGGMGVVYRALDPLLERVVALKTISAHLDSQPELRARFFREGRSAAHLSHRNIITIYDIGEDNGVAYLAMEYLEGQDLKATIAKRARFSLQKKLAIVTAVCEGLAHAHNRQVIHRDIKPANIFMSKSGEIKILDFGLARMVSAEITRTGAPLGTPNYMSPEQVRGERVDHRADIFSVGAVFYELLALRRPFDEDSLPATILKILQADPEPLEEIDPSLDPGLTAVVMKALAKEPDARFQSAEELLGELRRFTLALPPAPEEEDTAVTSSVERSWTGELLDLPTIETPVEARAGFGSSGDEGRVHPTFTAPDADEQTHSTGGAGRQGLPSPAPEDASPVLQSWAGTARRRGLFWGAAAGLLLVLSSVWWIVRSPGTTAVSGDTPPASANTAPASAGGAAKDTSAEGSSSEAKQPGAAPEGGAGGSDSSTAAGSTSDVAAAPPMPRIVPRSTPSSAQEAPLSGTGRVPAKAAAEVPRTAPQEPDPAKGAAQSQLAAAAQKAADEALSQMTQARSRAENAGAAEFAAKSYDAARRSEAEARTFYDAGQYEKAGARLYETIGLYSSAALEAGSKKETEAHLAEQERKAAAQQRSQAELARQAFEQVRVAAEGAGAQQREPAKFQEAASMSAQAQSAFNQQDYAGAKNQWDAASSAMERARAQAVEVARLPAPAAPDATSRTTPVVSPEAERQLIASSLQQYAAALRARDLTALKAVWPGLTGKQEQAMRDEFRNARDIGVELLDLEIRPAGDAATASARRIYVLQTLDGRRLETSNRMAITLRKSGGAWLLEKIRFEPLR